MNGFVEPAAAQGELEDTLNEMPEAVAEQQVLDLSPDDSLEESITDVIKTEQAAVHAQERIDTMEKVMNQGMEFLAGMFKMATGKDMGTGAGKVEVDRQTGEVVMRFKFPEL